MKKVSTVPKKMIAAIIVAAVLLTTVFAAGRYGWKLFGFSVCESAGIECVEVTDGQVQITGFYPGSFPQGFLGYHAEEVDGKLYVGFKFSGLFGIFETGDFDITIPVKGEITEVIIQTRNNAYPIWPETQSIQVPPSENESDDYASGIYVMLDRSDVYSLGWHFENKSGGMTNADNSPLCSGERLYLDHDIVQTANNLERTVPFMLTVADSMGKKIAQVNLVFDPTDPVLFVTITADGQVLVNGEAVVQPEMPAAYEAIISQYQTAISEGWSGQQLVDAGLNYMIHDVQPEAMGYTVEDLDGDGTPEFAIGTASGDAFYGKLILALYTLDDDGEPVQIFSSIERDRYYYAGGIRFANLGSSAFDDSFATTLKLEGKELVDMTYITDPADYVQMELTPFGEWSK